MPQHSQSEQSQRFPGWAGLRAPFLRKSQSPGCGRPFTKPRGCLQESARPPAPSFETLYLFPRVTPRVPAWNPPTCPERCTQNASSIREYLSALRQFKYRGREALSGWSRGNVSAVPGSRGRAGGEELRRRLAREARGVARFSQGWAPEKGGLLEPVPTVFTIYKHPWRTGWRYSRLSFPVLCDSFTS